MVNLYARVMSMLLKAIHAKREAGFNCAEGVFWGVTRSLDLEVPVSCVTGFGGGIGGTGSVCGALLGAIAAVGVYFGRTEPGDLKAKQECNALCAELTRDFADAIGTEICEEILGHLPGKDPASKVVGINPKCQKAVTIAFTLALEKIGESVAN